MFDKPLYNVCIVSIISKKVKKRHKMLKTLLYSEKTKSFEKLYFFAIKIKNIGPRAL